MGSVSVRGGSMATKPLETATGSGPSRSRHAATARRQRQRQVRVAVAISCLERGVSDGSEAGGGGTVKHI